MYDEVYPPAKKVYRWSSFDQRSQLISMADFWYDVFFFILLEIIIGWRVAKFDQPTKLGLRLSAFLYFWSSHISHVIIRIQISRNELRRWVLRPKGLLACLFVYNQSRDGKRWSWWCMPNIITIWFKWSSSARGPGVIISDHSSILWACV
jgi:hypothetical protein